MTESSLAVLDQFSAGRQQAAFLGDNPVLNTAAR